MPNFICTTCGTQHAEGEQPPTVCAVCQDERQYLKVTGQQWTTLDRLRLTHRNSIRFEEPGLTGIGVEPHFAIGQRALLVLGRRAAQLADGLDVPLETIAHLPSELWSPEACPLCAARVPLQPLIES